MIKSGSLRRITATGGAMVNQMTAKSRTLTPVLDATATIARYDVSRVNTMLDGSGNPITANGAVQTWQDISGNAYHLTANASNNRPTYRTTHASSGNKPSLQFIADDLLGKGSLSLAIANGYHTFAVINLVDNAQWKGGIAVVQAGAIENYHTWGASGAGQAGHWLGARDSQASYAAAYKLVASVDTPAVRDWRENGVQRGINPAGWNAGNIESFGVGGRVNSAGIAIAHVASMFVSEFVILDGNAADATKRAVIEAELRAKWGI